MSHPANAAFDYIVVGSGAGGAPLAARLVEAGYRVLVIEAGSDQLKTPGPEQEVTLVPSFHGLSTEHEALSWEFFVKHYDNPLNPDGKCHPKPGAAAPPEGIFYPRTAALGGCTVHNAMITIAGPDSDWEDLADFVGDDSWRSGPMRAYFQRLEYNEYQPEPGPSPMSWWGRFWDILKWVAGFGDDHSGGRHGFSGWLHTSVTDISLVLPDKRLLSMIKGALFQSIHAGIDNGYTWFIHLFKGSIFKDLDPNHSGTQATSPEGVVLVPLAVCGPRTTIHQNAQTPFVQRGRRSGPREFLLEMKERYPDRLEIMTEAFVTRVIFAAGAGSPRAVGVKLLRGKELYAAHKSRKNGAAPAVDPEKLETVLVKEGGEIVLSGGAFNTPQLLMLSGIGDEDHLARTAETSGNANACTVQGTDGAALRGVGGQPLRIHLPGVGRNLQDRYEITVVSKMSRDFTLLDGATFSMDPKKGYPDRHLKQWRAEGTGLYTSNGTVLGILKRSKPELEQPDLFIFGLPLPFRGYDLGYSNVTDQRDFFTWAILKGHTRNSDGVVRLQNANPLDTPDINFHYFNEVSCANRGAEDPDLRALVEGVKFVRGIASRSSIFDKPREEYPGASIPSSDDALKSWIMRDAWGHHACGTCRMGADDDKGAVLDSRFRVKGVDGLRVVDASIFPRIPGYFIVTNIYMASEKAADVLVEDARYRTAENPVYPRELRRWESDAVNTRRKAAGLPLQESDAPAPDWAADTVGLALSGGGVRSATFNLGILQAMARHKWLRRIDFMSTVSGGGYIGTFLGRWFDRLRPQSEWGGAASRPTTPAMDTVEREINDPRSPALSWLRRHANYIAPPGAGNRSSNSAIFVRNFVSVHVIVGLLLFAIFGLVNAARYGLVDPATGVFGLIGINVGELPLSYLLRGIFGPFYSAWFLIFELVLLFMVVPRILAYWIVSQDHHQRYDSVPLFALLVTAGLLLFASLGSETNWPLLLIGLAFLASFFHVEIAWRRARKREAAIGSGSVETQRSRGRNLLTEDLGMALVMLAGLLVFAVIDAVAHGAQQAAAGNKVYLEAFTAFGAGLVALAPLARFIADFFVKKSGPSRGLGGYGSKDVAAGLMAAILFALPLIFASFAAHVLYDGGLAIGTGLQLTGAAALLSLIFAHPRMFPFVNLSSLSQSYASRLARAYLGATNPLRFRAQASNVTEVVAGDDVASLVDYQPHAAGGPIHLINMTVNETVDYTSQRASRDRQGEAVAVSTFGMTIGKVWHSAWSTAPSGGLYDHRKGPIAMRPVGHTPGRAHPLLDESGKPAQRAEMLSLRQWMAISGAAFGPGLGQSTSLGTALMFGLANLRTGYWWNSGIGEAARDGFPALTVFRRLLHLLKFVFQTHGLILSEWLARFPGPWNQYWYLSDGGHFEVLGAYELIRRKVPRIIICDASADASYEMESMANLIRKARIDFNARIEPFKLAEYDSFVSNGLMPLEIRAQLGSLDELRPEVDGDWNLTKPAKKRASLFWVFYGDEKRRSLLLYVRANLTGDESEDIRHYRRVHPYFPNDPTDDQFFDEAQWESYRALGDHAMSSLCAGSDWFWKIPV